MEMSVMAALRFLAALFALVALVALASDAAQWLTTGQAFAPKSVLEHWQALSPKTLASTREKTTASAGEGAWALLSTTVFAVPTAVMFAGLAAVLGYAGRRRRIIKVYVN
jgi:flagellar biosynthesis protein FlhB